jgi:uncharacterized protein YjbI with pentapeptide repeats
MVSKKNKKNLRNTTKKYKKISQRGGNKADDDLVKAVIDNDNHLVQTILENRRNATTENGRHLALGYAIQTGNTEAVRLLLTQYIDLTRQFEGHNFLRYAVEEGHNDIVRLLLKNSAVSREVNLSDYDLSNTIINHVVLSDSDFTKADLSGTTINDSHINWTNFQHANLTNATIIDCNLTWSNFQHAILTGARFIRCNLVYANLKNTDLSGVEFIGSTIAGMKYDQGALNRAIITAVSHDDSISEINDNDENDISTIDGYSERPSLGSIIDSMMNIYENDDKPDEIDILHREPMKIAEYTKTPLTWSKRTHFNLILQEDTNYCEYITETPNNLLFLYGEQVAFVDKDILKQLVDKDTLNTDKIVFQCKNVDNAFVPRDENIIGGPNLNMDIFGLFGIIIPLSYIDSIIEGNEQIFVIEPIGTEPQMVIASLNTRLGGNVVGANHCQAKVNMQIGSLTYVPVDGLIAICNNQVTTPNTGGNRRPTKKSKRVSHKSKTKSKRIVGKK